MIEKNYPAFYLYVWLCNHKDEFEMNEYFIKRGTGMDYRTFRKNLLALEKIGVIKLSSVTNSKTTNSSVTTIMIVGLLTNKNKKQEENKQEEKPE